MDLMRSLPLGLYLEQPVTVLHRLDARVKLAWLLMFLLAPILASGWARVALSLLLVAIALGAGIPWRAWRQQAGWLLLVTFFAALLTFVAPDGYALQFQARSPADPAALERPAPPAAPWYNPFAAAPAPKVSPLPQPTEYRYWLFRQGPLRVSRRSFDLGVRLATLIFILIYSTTLYLLVTMPEEVAAGLDSLLRPLGRFGVPVAEVILTLTLALRFIPLVLEEVQNLVQAVRTRAIDWRKLGVRGGVKIWLMITERLLENLLRRAAQMAEAMKVRGFTSPDRHTTPLYEPRLARRDCWALAVLAVPVGLRLVWGWQAF